MTEKALAVANELETALGIRQAARLLRLTANALYAAASNRRLRVLRIGGKLYVPLAEVERLLLAGNAA